MIMKKCKVLFLCVGNSARSQMAEGLLRWHNGEQFEVFSAGVEPKGINPLTIEVMNEMGYDMSEPSFQTYGRIYRCRVTLTISLLCAARLKRNVRSSREWGYGCTGQFEDPAAFEGTKEEKLNKFRQVRDQIDCKMLDWMTEIGYLATA